MKVLAIEIEKVAIGLVAGVAVLLILFGVDRWRNRRAYGYSVYQADSLRRRLVGWGLMGMVAAVTLGGFALFRVATAPSGTPVLQAIAGGDASRHELYGEYALNIGEVGVQRAPVVEVPFSGQTWAIGKITTEV